MDSKKETVKRTDIDICKQCGSSRVFMDCHCTKNKLIMKIF